MVIREFSAFQRDRSNRIPLRITTTVLPSCPSTPVVRLIFSAKAQTKRTQMTLREITMFWRMIERARRLSSNGVFHVFDLVVHQNHVGLFERGIGAARAHSY